jgi:hypothetical protein
MRRLSGQAVLTLMRLLHWAAGLALLLVILGGVGVTMLGWRLSQGPLDLPWLVHRLEARVNTEDKTTHLSIGSAALAWEGFRGGVDRPLDLRLRAVDVSDASGAKLISVPSADVSLSLLGLLFGRIEPRGIEIDDAQIKVFRSASGDISLDLGTLSEATDAAAPDTSATEESAAIRLPALVKEFGKPASNDLSLVHSRFGQLRRVRIENASVVVVDHQLQATWRAPKAEIDLTRRPEGGVEGHAELTVSLGDQTAKLSIAASLAEGGTSTHVRAAITPVAPAALARAAAPLAPLSALSAPVSATMTLDLGPTLAVQQARIAAQVGAGDLHVGSSTIPVLEGTAVVSGNQDAMTLDEAQLSFRGHDGSAISVLSGKGTLQRMTARIHTQLALRLDQVSFADLPAIWPEGIGGGARAWITQNITAGTARNGHVDIQLDVQPDFSDATLSAAHGTLDGDGLTVYWLRPIQPIDHGVAQLRILDPDTMEIVVQSGRQRPEGAKTDTANGGLAVRGGTVKITGIMQHEQNGKIDANLGGSLGDAIAVLRSPRLHLLDHQAVDLSNVSGQVAAKLSVALPLDDKVSIDAIAIGAQAHLEDVRVPGIVAGRDLNQGAVDLKASNDGMTIGGQAVLGSIPATFDAAMDFRAGPPTQMLQTVNVSGQPTAAQLTEAGLNPAGVFVGGAAGVRAKLTERRDGQGVIAVSADLGAADMRLDVAGWTKPAGDAAQGAATLRMDHNRLVGVEQINLTGTGVAIQGRANFAAGKASVLQIDQFTLGGTSAKGSVSFPPPAGGPIVATVSGTTIDLSSRLTYHAPKAEQTATDRVSVDKTDEKPGMPWKLDARFDHAVMANEQIFDGLVLHAEDDGSRLNRLRFDARAAPNEPILLEITPVPGGRRLTANAADAGRLLRALDVMRTMEGGHLTVAGSFDDRAAGEPLSGTAEIADFRIRDAPAMARVLQAMTLYGLVDMVGGPGLGFAKLIAPFRLTGPVLELSDARAFSASLGLTAKGRIDLAADRADLDGTVVPAYFFNSLLGRVPLLGKLFSPESGGGLFAANYSVRGKLSDPEVSVNPLSALTPGILRGLFGNM